MKFKSAIIVVSLLVLAVFSAQVMAYSPAVQEVDKYSSSKNEGKAGEDQNQEPISVQIKAAGVTIHSGFSLPTIWSDLISFKAEEWTPSHASHALVSSQDHLQQHYFRKVLFQYIISSQAP